MSQVMQIGDAEASALMKVEKADGRVLYFRVVDNVMLELTQDEYDEEMG